MAEDTFQNVPMDPTLEPDPAFDFWTIDPRLTALTDQSIPSQTGSPMPTWNDQLSIEQTQNNFGSHGTALDLEGNSYTDLATRSKTPGSDYGQYASSPGLGSGIAQLNTATYRSRLPRRRSLYSRSRPVIRKTALATNVNEPLWVPEDSQAVETSTFDMNMTSDQIPLRRSDSSTSIASVGSECSNSSAYSTASASSATSSRSRRNSSLHRRQRKKTLSTSSSRKANPDSRPFKCTFCCDTFKSKYDWRRHEKSLHLDLEVYKCAPPDGTVDCPDSLGRRCAYCYFSNPDQIHLESHNHIACASRAPAARSFRRRDHLAQHLRVFHKLRTLPQLDNDWVDQVPPVTSRCGFCDSRLASWEERADHLAAHFRQGSTMKDWQGGHGFDDYISARLTNAVPPYCIGSESQSLVPFSATSAGTKDHFAQISARTGVFQRHDQQNQTEPSSTMQTPAQTQAAQSSSIPTDTLASATVQTTAAATAAADIPPAPAPQQPATATPTALLDSRALTASAFADILASHLARFALEYKALGIRASDEMLQREARQVLYSSDDPWNQTIADIPLWLQEFRQRHGLE